jgi:hypothetical protein
MASHSRDYGVEAARVVMGHSSLDATEIDPEADVVRARRAAGRVGQSTHRRLQLGSND